MMNNILNASLHDVCDQLKMWGDLMKGSP